MRNLTVKEILIGCVVLPLMAIGILLWSDLANAAELKWYPTASTSPTADTELNAISVGTAGTGALYLTWTGASVDDSEWIHFQKDPHTWFDDYTAELCFTSDTASATAGTARIQVRFVEETDQTPSTGPANTNGSHIISGATLTGADPYRCIEDLKPGWYKVMTTTDDASDLSMVVLRVIRQ